MRAIYCEDCVDLVVPRAGPPQSCSCGRHTVWRADAGSRMLFVHDREANGRPSEPRAYVVLIYDEFFRHDGPVLTAADVEHVLKQGTDRRFHTVCSLIVKMRPDHHPLVQWAEALPSRP